MQHMTIKMPVKNILTKLLRERNITPYAFWKEMSIGQNTAYRLCNDPESIPSKKIVDRIYEVYNWLPGDYLVSDRDWDAWLKSLPKQERNEVLEVADSYMRKTKDGRIRKDQSSKLVEFPNVAA
jgi:plasmid maintenance system antidote protein VapI